MDIKLKFPPESIAFFIKSESEFKKIRVKLAEVQVKKEGILITYTSDEQHELGTGVKYNQEDLLSRREFSDHVNGLS